MKLDKQLFDKIAAEAAVSPRLRKNFDLRDSEDENSQRMLNVLQPGSKVPIHRHNETSEIVVCIQGTVIERFHDAEGRVTKEFTMIAGSDMCTLWIPKGQYHSLDCNDTVSVIVEFKAGKYDSTKTEDILNK